MGRLAEVWASEAGVDFEYNKESQKYIIEFILRYCNYDLVMLAEILDVSPLLLSHVISGFSYLNDRVALRLMDWFFIIIRD